MSDPDDRGLSQFDRNFFGGEQKFTRVGRGELGGKAAGLEMIRNEILSRFDADAFPDVQVAVPTLTVLTTQVFDLFMERNELHPERLAELSDVRIAHSFQRASFPSEFVGDLRALITNVHTPLAVRSSSLLEDALSHPFAGVYGTKMIPNNQPDVDTRFRKLVEAVKFVYSSTCFRGARAYVESVGRKLGDEKMAVVIQEVIGTRHRDRFYPELSGVGRSFNYYPSGHAKPEDGVVNLALGLGRQIVDGGLSWTYSPAYPKSPVPFNNVGDLLKKTQTTFWSINMGKPPAYDPTRETEYLVKDDLACAEEDGALRHLASTYDGASDRLRPGMNSTGPRVLDFAPILRIDAPPLNDVLVKLLELSREAEGADVEIEFAASLGSYPKGPVRLGFLQARPMMVSDEVVTVSEADFASEGVLAATDQALGNGVREDLQDVVYLKPDRFAAESTRSMVGELEQINRALVAAGRNYLLMGFGRWGSSDPWLGVPVEWSQINGARVIVEATLPDMITDMSQGSHFFHNVISFEVLYLSIRHSGPYPIDWAWLDSLPCEHETPFVRHVRLPKALRVKVDGRGGGGVIKRHE